ncbi:MAG: nicotinamide-nucleotide amidohydrolase family protein [Elusimicrobiales bacterium]|jgi:nicotinamide-nucleotide amidase|nr:nicotinamide-nucleotide amidohydrolase family protein [Elusimicrobiales bacterium]
MRPEAELLCTGSELVSSKVNLYSPLFAARLLGLGVTLRGERSLRDDLPLITRSIREAMASCPLVITCGGLGPTFDDLTRRAAARALGLRLVSSPDCAAELRRRYSLEKLPPNMADQAVVLEGARTISNRNGTAFGQVIRRGRRMLVLLPGPLREWEPMFGDGLAREISSFFGLKSGTVLSARLKAAGLKEVQAERLVRPVLRSFAGTDFTILAGADEVEFSFTVRGRTPALAERRLAAVKKAARRALGGAVYSETGEGRHQALGRLLKDRGATLALAESCTGGLASKLMTDEAGSSDFFLGGVTSYSNAAKVRLLGVSPALVRRRGAVSAECAAAMARGARRAFGSDYAGAVTGIAGPAGGTPEKPVGTVFFGICGPRGVSSHKASFRGTRDFIRLSSANRLFDLLGKIIE